MFQLGRSMYISMIFILSLNILNSTYGTLVFPNSPGPSEGMSVATQLLKPLLFKAMSLCRLKIRRSSWPTQCRRPSAVRPSISTPSCPGQSASTRPDAKFASGPRSICAPPPSSCFRMENKHLDGKHRTPPVVYHFNLWPAARLKRREYLPSCSVRQDVLGPLKLQSAQHAQAVWRWTFVARESSVLGPESCGRCFCCWWCVVWLNSSFPDRGIRKLNRI